jgi:hypothetical protein
MEVVSLWPWLALTLTPSSTTYFEASGWRVHISLRSCRHLAMVAKMRVARGLRGNQGFNISRVRALLSVATTALV